MQIHALVAKYYVTTSRLGDLIEMQKDAIANKQITTSLTSLREGDSPRLSTRAVSMSMVTGSFSTLSFAKHLFKPVIVASTNGDCVTARLQTTWTRLFHITLAFLSIIGNF